MNKETLIKAIIERLRHDQKLFFQAAQTAHKAATDPENIPDNKYETLALESSYLAQGQANRAQDLQHAIDLYTNLMVRRFSDGDQVYLSALVVIESEEGNRRSIFLGPAAGGLKIQYDNREIIVITPESPLGRDLLGKEVGDSLEIKVDNSVIEYELIELH